MKTMNVTLAGVGGQGILLVSEILARTAAIAGMDVKKSEIHGMSQRGGSVTSQVRFGTSVHSPIIPAGETDILAAFDKLEALRWAGVLASGGKALVNNLYVTPITVTSGQQQDVAGIDGRLAAVFPAMLSVDAAALAAEAGNERAMNMAMAGALSALCPFKESHWLLAMAEMMSGPKAKFLEVNKRAFALGRAKAGA